MKSSGPAFVFPLTPRQLEIFWGEHGHLDVGSAYHITANYRLTGPVRPELITAAFDALVRRHEALRTVIRMVAGEPRQVVLPPAVTTSLRHVDCEPNRTTLERELREIAERPFLLNDGPLIRAILLRISVDHYVFSLVVHHIVADGRSTGLMIDELTTDYAARAAGSAPIGDRQGLQFADFTLWLAEAVTPADLERQARFWQRQLIRVPREITLPSDRPRSSVRDNVADHHEFAVPANVTARLRTLARESGVTLYMLLLAVTQVMLGRRSGQELFVLGSNTEHRALPEFADVVGCFASRVPIKADLRGEPSLTTLLPRVRQSTVDALANQDVAFDESLAEPNPPWAPGPPAIRQVTFQLFHDGFAASDTVAADVRFEPIMGPTERMSKELTILFVDDGELRCGLQWLTALFDRDTMITFAADLLALLGTATRRPHESIWRLPLASKPTTLA